MVSKAAGEMAMRIMMGALLRPADDPPPPRPRPIRRQRLEKLGHLAQALAARNEGSHVHARPEDARPTARRWSSPMWRTNLILGPRRHASEADSM
jgi:hypothetical protein